MLNKLVDFVVAHRRRRVFMGMSASDVRRELESLPVVFSTDGKGQVNGIVVYEPDPSTETLFIRRILTNGRGIIAQFLAKAGEYFPGYTMVARRHGRVVNYNTPRFMHLLARLT